MTKLVPTFMRFKWLIAWLLPIYLVCFALMGERQMALLSETAKCVGEFTAWAESPRSDLSQPDAEHDYQAVNERLDCGRLPTWFNAVARRDNDQNALMLLKNLQTQHSSESDQLLTEIVQYVNGRFEQFKRRQFIYFCLALVGVLIVIMFSTGRLNQCLLWRKSLSNLLSGEKNNDFPLSEPMSPLAVAVHQTCETESIKSGYAYVLEVTGDKLICVTDEQYPLIEASICEMVANAIIHGGRNSAARLASGKPDTLKVFVGLELINAYWSITIADDGEGIDEMTVMQHAVASKLVGEQAVRELAPGDGVKLILLAGFSSAIANRQGPLESTCLASIKSAAEYVGGTLSLRNRPSVFCEFTLVLPA